MTRERAIIFANGIISDASRVLAFIRPEDTIIAADGGLRHIKNLGLSPHILIGDMDSISSEAVERMQSSGVQIVLHPKDKDETDLELALLEAIGHGFTIIRVVAALGGRLDHTLANIYLLEMQALQGLDVRLDDGQEEVFIIRQSANICGQPGDIVSLLALDSCVRGIHTEGLKYPLKDESLYRHISRGVSNGMLSTSAVVRIKSGRLLCIHSRKRT